MDPLQNIHISDPNSPQCLPPLSYDLTSVIAIASSILGILWMGYNILMLRRIDFAQENQQEGEEELIQDMPPEQKKILLEFGYKNFDASFTFLKLEYLLCLILVVITFLLLMFLSELGLSVAISFLIGALISMAAGLGGLVLTLRASARVAYCCKYGLGPAFKTAYQCCSAIGFGVTSFTLLGITVAIQIFKNEMGINPSSVSPNYFLKLFQAVAGYGLGSSLVGLVTRMSGSIFEAITQAGSQLVGKTQGALPFTHTRNAATVALHAGHHIEGIVGAGCDLLGSYSQLTCVAFLLGSNTLVGWQGDSQICAANLSILVFPLTVLSVGLVISLGVNVIGIVSTQVQTPNDLTRTIRNQKLISSGLMAAALYLCCFLSLPSNFKLQNIFYTLNNLHHPWEVYLCTLLGTIVLLALSFFGQFATHKDLFPIQFLANKSRRGPAAGITLGLAFGYLASFIPATLVVITAFYGYQFLGFYGISVTILGIIATFPLQLSLQNLGPLALSTFTSVKMANLGQQQRDTASCLDQAGQTTGVISRSVSLGCSALVGLTLFGGFLRNAKLDSSKVESNISLTEPDIFAGLMMGAFFPFLIAGLTVRASRKASRVLVQQIQNQLKQEEGIANQEVQIDYGATIRPACITVIKHLIMPIVLVVILPFIFGIAMSPEIIAGMLPGIIVSGMLFSSSATISGQSWTSTKKLIEKTGFEDDLGHVHGVGSVPHRASLIGNSLGQALKKNAGCSINASIKLMGMLAVLFGSKFAQIHS